MRESAVAFGGLAVAAACCLAAAVALGGTLAEVIGWSGLVTGLVAVALLVIAWVRQSAKGEGR
jgi:predicted MFS family arabinose efflux permease